jgi:hypothetical protein
LDEKKVPEKGHEWVDGRVLGTAGWTGDGMAVSWVAARADQMASSTVYK